MLATSKKQSEIDPKLIIPFVNSVKKVLATMAGLEITVERSRFKTHLGPEYDYSGIIGFSGKIVGTVVVSFQREAAIPLVNAFACCQLEADSSDFSDALGELTNMIAGAAKNDFGGMIDISVPTVVMGKGHIIGRPSDIPCLVIPCVTASGGFAIELSIKRICD